MVWMAIASTFGGVVMKDVFGYFGSGLEGYVQYNEAFKRNFDGAVVEPVGNDDTDEVAFSDDKPSKNCTEDEANEPRTDEVEF